MEADATALPPPDDKTALSDEASWVLKNPTKLSKDDLYVARKEAKSLPECFYKQNNLPVITPANVQAFLIHMNKRLDLKEVSVALWSWYSGTGRLASTMVANNRIVLFAVDLRYGWDLNDPDTFRMLMQSKK